MNILKVIRDIVSPVTELIDEMHTSEEEKLKAKHKILELQVKASEAQIEYNKVIAEKQGDIIKAEAQGESFLQRNWRPITMLIFVGIIVARMFGLTNDSVTEAEYIELWELMKIGLGGYVAGRTVEKVGPKIIESFKKK